MLGAHPPIAGCLAEPCYLVCRQTEGNSIVLEGGQICNCAVIFYRIGACTPPFAGDVTPRLTKNGTERSEVALVAYYSNWMGLRNARFGYNLNGGGRSGLDRRYYAYDTYRLFAPYIEATFTTAAAGKSSNHERNLGVQEIAVSRRAASIIHRVPFVTNYDAGGLTWPNSP
jgi:hypothetical protein